MFKKYRSYRATIENEEDVIKSYITEFSAETSFLCYFDSGIDLIEEDTRGILLANKHGLRYITLNEEITTVNINYEKIVKFRRFPLNSGRQAETLTGRNWMSNYEKIVIAYRSSTGLSKLFFYVPYCAQPESYDWETNSDMIEKCDIFKYANQFIPKLQNTVIEL